MLEVTAIVAAVLMLLYLAGVRISALHRPIVAFYALSPLGIGVAGVSSVTLFSLGAAPIVLTRVFGRLSLRASRILLLLALWQVIAIAWSPNPTSALPAIAATLACIAVLASVLAVDSSHRIAELARTLLYLAPLVVAQAGAVVLFRLDPSAEAQYLTTGIANALTGGEAARVAFGLSTANVTDPLKAAGLFFVNGNRASMALGVASMAYLTCYVLTRRRFLLFVALSGLVGVIATGSKTGLALAIVLPLAAVAIATVGASRGHKAKALRAVVWLVLGSVACLGVGTIATDYIEAVDQTLVPRWVLWGTAINAIASNPLTGLGHGGWWSVWEPVALANGYGAGWAPHSFILYRGVEYGIVGVVLIVAFLWTIFGMLWSGRREATTMREHLAVGFSLAAWAWTVVHGLGDNTDFFGVTNSLPFAAIALALVYRRHTETAIAPPREVQETTVS